MGIYSRFGSGLVCFAVIASSCGSDAATLDAEPTTNQVAAPEQTATTVAPTTTISPKFAFDEEGLSLDALREMITAVRDSNGAPETLEPFGTMPPVDFPGDGKLSMFAVSFTEGSRPGTVKYQADIQFDYPKASTEFSDLEKFLDDLGTQPGWNLERNGDKELPGTRTPRIRDRKWASDEFIENGKIWIYLGDNQDLDFFDLQANYDSAISAIDDVGDPSLYSSWYEDVVPVPADGVLTQSGVQWVAPRIGVSRSDPDGETYTAEFEYLQREELELKDETRELAADYDVTISEDDGTLVLENDEFVATYNFRNRDRVVLTVTFKITPELSTVGDPETE